MMSAAVRAGPHLIVQLLAVVLLSMGWATSSWQLLACLLKWGQFGDFQVDPPKLRTHATFPRTQQNHGSRSDFFYTFLNSSSMVADNGGRSEASAFGEWIREEHFSFAPGYRPLNHGSFGAFPKSVGQYQRQLQLDNEAKPDTFLRYKYPKLLEESRAAIAPLIGAHTDEVVFVPNATTGVNTVLRNLQFGDGDVALHFNTIYPSCLKTLQSLGETTPLTTHCIELRYPIEDEEIGRQFEDAVRLVRAQGRTVKLAIFDTVSTFPGVRFPWEPLVKICRALRILSFVDGAHGLGHIDLTHLGAAKPDFFISNCYK